MMCNASYGASQHGADEKARAEDPTGVPRGIARASTQEFQDHQQGHQLERHSAVQSVADIPVANAKDLGHKPAYQTDQQPTHHWLEPHSLLWEPQEALPHAQKKFGKRYRHQTADDAEHRIDREFQRMK